MIKAIILDFDGVVLESCDIKTQAFRKLFEDYPEYIDAIVDYHLNHGGVSRYKKFVYFYNNILKLPLSDKKLEELGKRFSELVFEEIKRCDCVPGAMEFLDKYSQILKLYVASGTPETELQSIVKMRGLDQYFKGVYGTPATKSEIIMKILDEENLKKDEVIFVGDSETDYIEAKKSGLPFIARLNRSIGFKLDEKSCLHVVSDLHELIKFIDIYETKK